MINLIVRRYEKNNLIENEFKVSNYKIVHSKNSLTEDCLYRVWEASYPLNQDYGGTYIIINGNEIRKISFDMVNRYHDKTGRDLLMDISNHRDMILGAPSLKYAISLLML